MTALLVVNALVALGSAAFGVLAVVRPAAMPGVDADGVPVTLYARLFASRSVPLGLATAAATLASLGQPGNALPWLGLGFAVQALDAAIGFESRRWGMVAGGGLAAAIHAATVAAILVLG